MDHKNGGGMAQGIDHTVSGAEAVTKKAYNRKYQKTDGEAASSGKSSSPARKSLASFEMLEKYLLILVWCLVVLGFGMAEPARFLSVANFSNIFGSQTVLLVLAMSLILPLTNGDIDLSVGALAGLVAMVIAVLNVEDKLPIVPSCVVGVSVGVCAGFVNGWIVTRARVDPFIVTLGTGTVFTGIVYWLSSEQTITGVSTSLSTWIFTNQFLSIPLEFYYGLVIICLVWYIMVHTPLGQQALFIGQSRRAARLSGFRIERIRKVGFVTAGAIAGIAGMFLVGTNGAASPTTGDTLLLPAYAAAFLGATSIRPGRFNAVGSAVAVYFLATGVAGLELFGAQTFVQELFYGGVLVLAVIASKAMQRKSTGVVESS